MKKLFIICAALLFLVSCEQPNDPVGITSDTEQPNDHVEGDKEIESVAVAFSQDFNGTDGKLLYSVSVSGEKDSFDGTIKNDVSIVSMPVNGVASMTMLTKYIYPDSIKYIISFTTIYQSYVYTHYDPTAQLKLPDGTILNFSKNASKTSLLDSGLRMSISMCVTDKETVSKLSSVASNCELRISTSTNGNLDFVIYKEFFEHLKDI